MNRRSIAFILIVCLPCFAIVAPSNAATKAGSSCTKAGKERLISKKVYVCTKSGKKLVWKEKAISLSPVEPSAANTNKSEQSVDPKVTIMEFKDQFRKLTPFITSDRIDSPIPTVVIAIPKFDPTLFSNLIFNSNSSVNFYLYSNNFMFCSLTSKWEGQRNPGMAWRTMLDKDQNSEKSLYDRDLEGDNFKFNLFPDLAPAYWPWGLERNIATLKMNSWEIPCVTDWSISHNFGLGIEIRNSDNSKDRIFSGTFSYTPEKIIQSAVTVGARCASRDQEKIAQNGTKYVCSNLLDADGNYGTKGNVAGIAVYGMNSVYEFNGYFDEYLWRKYPPQG